MTLLITKSGACHLFSKSQVERCVDLNGILSRHLDEVVLDFVQQGDPAVVTSLLKQLPSQPGMGGPGLGPRSLTMSMAWPKPNVSG